MRKEYSEFVTWWAASVSEPSPVATTVVAVSENHRVAVRSTSQPPAEAAAPMPRGLGRSPRPSPRQRRTMTATSTMHDSPWAAAVAVAEPAMPRPRPLMSRASRPMFVTLTPIATAIGVRVSCRPRSSPVEASTTSWKGSPAATIRR